MPTSPPSTSSSRPSKSSVSKPAGPGRLVLVLALALLLPAPAPAAVSLDAAVQGIEATYRRVSDLKAAFEQASLNKTLNRTVDARGTLYLKKPGRLRWEYTTPTPQEIVSDGTRLWVYTPELKQVNVTAAPQALTGPAGTFLQGLGQVREHFQARFLNPAQPTDADGHVVLDFTPWQPEPLLARLILAVDPKSWLVRKAVLYDELGNTVTVRFGDVLVNSGLPDGLFVFVPPPGVAVIRQ
jgi:outer membrane lipoprotein carrier protein